MQAQWKMKRLAVGAAAAALVMGCTVLNGAGVQAIGGLCNGLPATHTWLDASGQYGPGVIDGTKGDDVIIGSDGDDTIDGHGGDDFICGGAGNDSISDGGGMPFLRGDTGDDDISAVDVDSATLSGGAGDDTLEVDNTVAKSWVYGGPGDDVLIHEGTGTIKAEAGEGFDDCLIHGGDEPTNCEY